MSRDMLFRSVFKGIPDSPISTDCFSPVSSLVHSLHASSLAHTPCKRLSLSSTLSDSSDLNNEMSFTSSLLDTSKGTMNSPCITPYHQNSPMNKENTPTRYYSPTHRLPKQPSLPPSPLREVQNVNKNLDFSPLKKLISPSKGEFISPIKKPSPLDDHDSNSRDSGYCESGQKVEGLVAPLFSGPKPKLNLDMSPLQIKLSSEKKSRSFASLSSSPSGCEDDFFMEMLGDVDNTSDVMEAPSSTFSSLLSAPIQCNLSELADKLPQANSRLPIRRCLSMVDTTTPVSSRRRTIRDVAKSKENYASPSLMSPPSNFPFKRPQPPLEVSSPADRKRLKLEPLAANSLPPAKVSNLRIGEKMPLTQRHLSAPENEEQHPKKIQRSHSETHLTIMKALNKSSNHSELTGDFSRPMGLPLLNGGKHPDLKCISIHTMASLMRGEFNDKIDSFKILDCRYPYEYEGGHIRGADNWHNPQIALDFLSTQTKPPKVTDEKSPRQIYIFHCEFSAERAPKIQRLIRETDRQTNKEHYPALHFPELYLLEGGYKAFYEVYSELCTPIEYVRMLDENHTDDLKHFRAKSKSWAAESKQGVRGARMPIARTGRKKLGL